MAHNLKTDLMDHVKDFYLEMDLEVVFDILDPIYGKQEHGVPLEPNIPKQVDIKAVYATGTKGRRVNIIDLLSDGDIINLEDELLSKEE